MFVKGVSLQKRILAWAVLLTVFGLLGLAVYGQAIHNGLYQARIIPVVLVAVLFSIYSKRRAARDPAYGQKIAQTRNRKRDAWLQIGGVAIALMICAGALLVRRFAPGFSALPKSVQRLYLLAGGMPIALLLNLVWLRLRRKKPSP